jgi:murein L,D-transpeptidase YafK
MKQSIKYFLILLSCISCYSQSNHYKNYASDLLTIIKRYNVDTAKISLLADKSDYKLSILADTLVLKEYPVVFGHNPVDDKLRQGDNCTPEGNFKMPIKYHHSKWSRFILINYPTRDSWRKHNLAISNGEIPKDSKIGGEIGIHGVPNEMNFLINIHYNWTAGCISMKNPDVIEIYPYIRKSTSIIIRK